MMQEPNILFYHGRSMRGTFKTGDMLFVETIPASRLLVGDIVVFKEQGSGELVVHRVAKTGNEILTRGDHNLFFDSSPLSQKSLMGRVTHFKRDEKTFCVSNGLPGHIKAKKSHTLLRIKKTAITFLRPFYSKLKQSGIVRKIWNPELISILIESENGSKTKYIHKGRTVLVKQGDRIIFRRRPYDLLF